MNDYSTYIDKSRYARWREADKRRENWDETVARYIDFYAQRIPAAQKHIIPVLRKAILDMEVMPSMRSLMTAGPALDRDNCAGFNCSYIAIDDPRAFDETLYILMCGTGVGFSVERQYVNQLPVIAENFYPTDTVLKVRDSRIGWAAALKELISLLYAGMVPTWDLSLLRAKGAVLKTFGGRSSGPEPLNDLFKFAVTTFQNAAGRKLNSLECHDLMCKIGDAVVSGGVRRSATISLSNLSDDRMRNAKTGQWWETNPQRALANNSAAYTEIPDMAVFMEEWRSLYMSKSGERGIFNRQAATLQAKKNGRRKTDGIEFGTNPCGEIILRSKGFCNLSEVVIRPGDSWTEIAAKVKIATILGTLQSTLTDFRYLRREWQKNAEEERLLGVSLTGIMDNKLTSTDDGELRCWLKEFRDITIKTNTEWAGYLGINPSVAITCVKPSGTVSQLVDSASGIHPRYAKYYIRSVRSDSKDPIVPFLVSQKVPNEPDVTKPNDVHVFYFPMQSPEGSVIRTDITAIDQLELYLTYREHWCEHNPSITVYVREKEWLQVATWVYENFNKIGGVSFLPYSDHIYKQAPYTEVSQAEYEKAVQVFPVIDWTKLADFEKEDNTSGSRDFACQAGACDI